MATLSDKVELLLHRVVHTRNELNAYALMQSKFETKDRADIGHVISCAKAVKYQAQVVISTCRAIALKKKKEEGK